MDLNRATLIGNVTRDPEARTTTTGQNVCSFSIATNSQWTDKSGQKQTRAEYHNIVAWGKLAEICQQYLTRGMKIFAEGKLQTREWTAQDGQKKIRTEIVMEEMIMLTPKSATGAPAPQPVHAAALAPHEVPPPAPGEVQDISLSDIPF